MVTWLNQYKMADKEEEEERAPLLQNETLSSGPPPAYSEYPNGGRRNKSHLIVSYVLNQEWQKHFYSVNVFNN